MKWSQILWQSIRDVGLTGFGVWVAWKQVEAPVPNPYLLALAAGCFWPAARSAVTAILSGPGQSSESSHPPEGPSSEHSPHEGGTDE